MGRWVKETAGKNWRRRARRLLASVSLGIAFSSPALAAEAFDLSQTSILWPVAAGSCALAIAGGLLGLSEHFAARRLRRNLRSIAAKAQAMLVARDSWLANGRESLMIWRANASEPLSYGEGAALMEACLTGPDAPAISAALDGLSQEGVPFDIKASAADGRTIALRGRPSGGAAVVYLEAAPAAAEDFGLRAVLDAIPLPIWVRRPPHLALSFVNRAFLAQSGAASEKAALAGNVAFDRSERELAASATSDAGPVEAKRFAVVSGRRRALQFTLSPLADGGVAGIALDVTALTDTEARLKQHTDLHAETLDRLSQAVAIFGPDKKLSFCNRAYCEIFGLPKAYIDQHPGMGEILDRLRETRRLPEQSNFREWRAAHLKLFERSDEIPDELWHLPSGTTLRVATQQHPFGGKIFLYEDVSSQLRLESSFNSLLRVQRASLNALREGIAVFGPDGKLRLHNTAFAELWGLAPADLSGEPHLKRIAEKSAARFGPDRAWEKLIAAVTPAAPELLRELGETERSDGRVISLSLAPLPDGATVASFIDVTDRCRIESALRERNHALEAADRLKNEFVRRMSYELRTPLNSIIGFTELLKTQKPGPLNDKQSEYATDIATSANELRNLVNNVLDLSEIESEALALNLETLDLFELLDDVATRAREMTDHLGLAFEFKCERDAGRFTGDAARLKQALFNILSNAIKYTPREGTVTLGGAIEGGSVRIYVKDTGPGVSPDLMPSAFERFSAKGVAVVRAGAGLGLALVNRFVELHKGWVELESSPGKGTTVTCHLPREIQTVPPARTPEDVSA